MHLLYRIKHILKSKFKLKVTKTNLNDSDFQKDCLLFSVGTWGIGLATRRANLSKVPLGNDVESWIMDQYGQVKHDNKVFSQFRTNIEEGDVVVINLIVDYVDLLFHLIKGFCL